MATFVPFIGCRFVNEHGNVDLVPEVRVGFLVPVTDPQFSLIDPAGNRVDIKTYATTGDSQGWAFTPTSPLCPATKYRIEITSARDAEGNVMADYSNYITTRE
ncbi:Ig-like domain-containing protein [Microtetraspora malaysiensis]|uniref:Ig-like domain-containing protein n=1 Tax=Microtetraspora malaysiensis TaxID=161358 RepID=UPI003D9032D6